MRKTSFISVIFMAMLASACVMYGGPTDSAPSQQEISNMTIAGIGTLSVILPNGWKYHETKVEGASYHELRSVALSASVFVEAKASTETAHKESEHVRESFMNEGYRCTGVQTEVHSQGICSSFDVENGPLRGRVTVIRPEPNRPLSIRLTGIWPARADAEASDDYEDIVRQLQCD